MSLPRYHDDVASPSRSSRAWRVWATLYDAVRRNPMLPVDVARDLMFQAFFYEDDEMGYIPRISIPIASVLAIVRQAIRTNPKRVRPGVPAKFKRIVQETFNAPEKITGEKLDMEGESQILGEMVDQRGSLRTILQGGITPFTNMRPQRMVLGRPVKYRPKNPVSQLTARSGTVSVPFALRFHSDKSNERSNAVLVFRHNKKGIDLQKHWYEAPSGFSYVNDTTADVDIVFVSAANAKTAEEAKLNPWEGTQTTVTVPGASTKLFTKGDWIPDTSAAYPAQDAGHKWGYADSVKVFPAQYANGAPSYPKIGSGPLKGPFEEVANDSSGFPQFYHCALNRSDLEDMSLQMQPQLLRRQGNIFPLLGSGSTTDSIYTKWAQQQGNLLDHKLEHYWYTPQASFSNFTNILTGWVPFSNEHSHKQKSQLCILNEADDEILPRPGDTTGKYTLTTGDVDTYPKRALGMSFKYDAILKTGGVKYTCVNRGGSGCNVDIHIFKLKLKHIADQGSNLTWAKLVKPYQDAYIKRAYEIITADDLKGRVSDKDDVWKNAKFPLLPGSRHVNREDEYLSRVDKMSCFIPSQGRKNLNIVFPGERYDPAAEQMVISDDTLPDYDKFTYFSLVSVTGEKSNAMFSTDGKLGTSVVSLADLYVPPAGAAAVHPDVIVIGSGPVTPSAPYDPSLPAVPVGYSTPSGNLDYDAWVYEHQDWGYLTDEHMFYLDQFIEYKNKDVTGWSQTTEGPFPGNPNVYSGYKYRRRIRLPLPSLQEWLDAKYDIAYTEQGRIWKPPKPKVIRKRYWSNYDEYVGPLFSRVRYISHTAATWVVFDHCEWPIYESDSSNSDVTPSFDPVDIEIPTVRTNFYILFFS